MFKDWNNKNIKIGVSKGGVIAVSHPYENLLKGDIKIWPPAEIVQKMYQSNRAKSFENDNYINVTEKLNYYCDLQSMHSEDAFTWNVFGTVKYYDKKTRVKFVKELFENIGLNNSYVTETNIWLWRRIPHPDTLTSVGPEIDFGIISDNTMILGEAKWLSGIGKMQGKNKNKDQIKLRLEFLDNFSKKIYKNIKYLVVLELSLRSKIDYNHKTIDSNVDYRNITWEKICNFKSHPLRDELINHYRWKLEHSII